MKNVTLIRISATFLVVFSLLSPTVALAGNDAKKYFKEGMKYETAEQWDKAAESFALAVGESPKNPEYRLHLQRSLFNASQLYMKKGRTAAEQNDFQGAYIAFRKAYAYDPVNELAKSEMARMVRLQEEATKNGGAGKTDASPDKIKLVPTGYTPPAAADPQLPQRVEKLRDVSFPGGVDLQYLVKELSKDLDLNVLFDAESRLDTRKVRIELKNVTAAKALDYLFLQEGLFFQKVGPRTILVVTNNRRQMFQQLVLRTFYLANANPKDIKTVVQTAIPAQPGRMQTLVLEDAATNSITVRDTEENIRLIGRLISSLDKDRAEVVMDVAIYEVNKNDLLQFGNQIGTTGQNGSLNNLGGVGFPLALAGTTGQITSGLPFKGFDAASIAFGLPLSSITALQTKSNTKLIASTQIHAFNNEDSSARIGQRVPVQTAQFITGNNNTSGGVVSNVITYEQVGLTLKFKPIVFPNQDVQVAMEIESKDVAGASSLTPIFTERTIKGTARVQNNKTLLLASVAQGVETNSRSGLPLLGLIPILGRLFTAPSRDNRQVDIVIAVTPRVIRAPAILPEDEVERPTGSLATPTSGSLEAMIQQEDREEMLAAARRLPTTARVQLPDQAAEAPVYVRSAAPTSSPQVETAKISATDAASIGIKPIDASAAVLDLSKTSNNLQPQQANAVVAGPTAEVSIAAAPAALRRGEKARIAVMINTAAPFRSAVVGFKFDARQLAVGSVSFGDAFGAALANRAATPFLNKDGKTYVSLSTAEGTAGAGVLAYVEVEALADGAPTLALDRDALNILTPDGKNFVVKP